MKIYIITTQLANKQPKDTELKKYNVIDPTNFNQIHQQLTAHKTNEIHVIDLTTTQKKEPGSIISVQDHINRTAINILRGKQKFLGIDFTDMTDLYQSKQNSIITESCGEVLNNKYEYPNHYLCNITTLAHALKIKNIYGYLYNTI